jgi:hypothetical protein
MAARYIRFGLLLAAITASFIIFTAGGCDCSGGSETDASGDATLDASTDASNPGDGGDAAKTDGGDGGPGPTCLYHPVEDFAPKIYGQWTTSPTLPSYKEVIALPVVMNMTDDNGDGPVDQFDTPDIAFISFEYNPSTTSWLEGGVLRVVSGEPPNPELREICANTDVKLASEAGMAGYIDKDGVPTIIASLNNRDKSTQLLKPSKLVQFHIVKDGLGGYKCEKGWESQIEVDSGWGSPSIADINNDGRPEIVIGSVVFKDDGTLMWKGEGGTGGRSGDDKTLWYDGVISVVADVDGDGKPEVVAGNTVYRDLDGSHYKMVWRRDNGHKDGPLNDGLVAVADINGDTKAEVVLVNDKKDLTPPKSVGQLYILEGATGNTICGPTPLPLDITNNNKGGAPMIADFDGDGTPEIGVAGAEYLTVFKNDCTVKWKSKVKDLTSNETGSSVFDFLGDGQAKAVYNDETKLRIYDGKNGSVIKEMDNTTYTTFEYPIIVDVNNDNKAEIVVVANTICATAFGDCSYPKNNGIRIYTDSNNNWVSTRKIWNQHAYHVTNVCSGEDDGYCSKDDNFYGRIPEKEMDNWSFEKLNNYRQNVQGPGGFAAPDFIVGRVDSIRKRCPDSLGLLVTVKNIGDSPAGGKEDVPDGGSGDGGGAVHIGVPVALYRGTPDSGSAQLLAVGWTSGRMAPNGGEATAELWWFDAKVTWPIDDLFVVANDDGNGGRAYNECDYSNNLKALGPTDCKPEG